MMDSTLWDKPVENGNPVTELAEPVGSPRVSHRPLHDRRVDDVAAGHGVAETDACTTTATRRDLTTEYHRT